MVEVAHTWVRERRPIKEMVLAAKGLSAAPKSLWVRRLTSAYLFINYTIYKQWTTWFILVSELKKKSGMDWERERDTSETAELRRESVNLIGPSFLGGALVVKVQLDHSL